MKENCVTIKLLIYCTKFGETFSLLSRTPRALTAPVTPRLGAAPWGVNRQTALVRDTLVETQRGEARQNRYLRLSYVRARADPLPNPLQHKRQSGCPPPLPQPPTTTAAPSPEEDNVINPYSFRRVVFSEGNGRPTFRSRLGARRRQKCFVMSTVYSVFSNTGYPLLSVRC